MTISEYERNTKVQCRVCRRFFSLLYVDGNFVEVCETCQKPAFATHLLSKTIDTAIDVAWEKNR